MSPAARERVYGWLLVLAVLAVAFRISSPHVFLAGNDASRFAAIESIVDFHQTSIERSHYAWTVDRFTLAGHDYSNKPPALALLGAAIYFAIQALTGWTFTAQEGAVVGALTFLLEGVPLAILAVLFFGALRRYPRLGAEARLGWAAALAFGTTLLSYSGTLNSHLPTAVLLFAAFLAAARARGFGAGLAAGLAVCLDPVPGLGLLPAFAWMLRERGEARAWFAGGLGLGGVFFLAANYLTFGSVLHPKLLPGVVDHSAAVGRSFFGIMLPDHLTYPLEVLAGGHGLFFVSPILLWGAWGLVRATRRGAAGPLPLSHARALGWSLLGLIVVHACLAGSYGGWSYGFRYFLPLIPLLFFFAPYAAGGARWLGPALVVSTLFAFLGAYHPWPPAFEQEAGRDPLASLVSNPVGGNAAAFAAEHWPDSAAARALGRWFVAENEDARNRYYALFFAAKGEGEAAVSFARRLPKSPAVDSPNASQPNTAP